MDIQNIFGQVVVPFLGGLLAGTYTRATTKFIATLVLLLILGFAFAVVPLPDGALAVLQARSQQVLSTILQVALQVPATAMAGFLLGSFIDRMRQRS